MAKSAEILQLSAKHLELVDELSCVNSQSAAEDTVSDDQKSVVVVYERSAERAKVTPRCKVPSATSTMA